MTAETPDIAKLAAEMRARAERALKLFAADHGPDAQSAPMVVRTKDVIAILDALARADARADKAEQDLARLTVNASTAYDRLKDERDAARETIGRLCEAGKPFVGYAKRADMSRMDDDGLRSVRVYEIRELARVLASVGKNA